MAIFELKKWQVKVAFYDTYMNDDQIACRVEVGRTRVNGVKYRCFSDKTATVIDFGNLDKISIPEKIIYTKKLSSYTVVGLGDVKDYKNTDHDKPYIFPGVENLINLSLLKPIAYIHPHVFCGAEKLASINISEESTGRFSKRFRFLIQDTSLVRAEYINGLKAKYILPQWITRIGSYAFAYLDTHMPKLEFEPDSQLEKVDDYAFYRSSFNNFLFPKTVKFLGCYCFANIYFPMNIDLTMCTIEILSEGLFYNSKLQRIKFPIGVKTIGYRCFSNTQLESISIPSSVEIIDNEAFKGCAKLSRISLDDEKRSELKHLGNWALSGTIIQSFSLPKKIESIGRSCFQNCLNFNLLEVYTKGNLTDIQPYAFTNTKLKFSKGEKVFAENFIIFQESLYTRGFNKLLMRNMVANNVLYIPPQVQEIQEGAFPEGTGLKEIYFHPYSVMQNIDFSVFPSSLVKIVFPPSVKSITSSGKKSFPNLISVIITSTNKVVYSKEVWKTWGNQFTVLCAAPLSFTCKEPENAIPSSLIKEQSNINRFFPSLDKWKRLDDGQTRELERIRESIEEFVEEPHEEHEIQIKPLSEYCIDFNKFVERNKIGSGATSEVVLMSYQKKQFAVKMFKQIDQWAAGQNFTREIETLISVKHPCIVKFYYFSLVPAMIAMEYVENGSILNWMNKMNNIQKCKAIIAIAVGMRYLHSISIIHRDLKPANILVDRNMEIRIADFGLAKFLDKEIDLTMTQSIGTPFYAAPEQQGGEIYDEKVDVYSFGLVLYEIVVGRKAFSTKLTGAQILKKKQNSEFNIPDFVLPLARELITYCLMPKSTERPSFTNIVDKLIADKFRLFTDINFENMISYYRSITTEGKKNHRKSQVY